MVNLNYLSDPVGQVKGDLKNPTIFYFKIFEIIIESEVTIKPMLLGIVDLLCVQQDLKIETKLVLNKYKHMVFDDLMLSLLCA